MEIHYCAQCRRRVSSVDLDQGRGVVRDGNVYCEACTRELGLNGKTGRGKPGTAAPPRKPSGAVRRKSSAARRGASGTGKETGRARSVSGVRRRPSSGVRRSPSRRRKARPRSVGRETVDAAEPRSDIYTFLIVVLGIVVVVLLVLIALILTRQMKERGAGGGAVPVKEVPAPREDAGGEGEKTGDPAVENKEGGRAVSPAVE